MCFVAMARSLYNNKENMVTNILWLLKVGNRDEKIVTKIFSSLKIWVAMKLQFRYYWLSNFRCQNRFSCSGRVTLLGSHRLRLRQRSWPSLSDRSFSQVPCKNQGTTSPANSNPSPISDFWVRRSPYPFLLLCWSLILSWISLTLQNFFF